MSNVITSEFLEKVQLPKEDNSVLGIVNKKENIVVVGRIMGSLLTVQFDGLDNPIKVYGNTINSENVDLGIRYEFSLNKSKEIPKNAVFELTAPPTIAPTGTIIRNASSHIYEVA